MEAIGKAFRASTGGRLRPRKILPLLGLKPGNDAKRDLREAMNAPANRLGIQTDSAYVPPLHLAIYLWLKTVDFASDVYDRVVRPAEVQRDGAPFLDPEKFRAVLQALERGEWSADRSPDTPWEALALFVLAFGLLQPTDAAAFLGTLFDFDDSYRMFFDEEANSTNDQQMTPDLLSARIDALQLRMTEVSSAISTVANELSRGSLPDTELAAKALTEIVAEFRDVQQLVLDGDAPVNEAPRTLESLRAIVLQADSHRKEQHQRHELLERLSLLRRTEGADAAVEALARSARERLDLGGELKTEERLIRVAATIAEVIERLDWLDDATLDNLRNELLTLGTDPQVVKLAVRGRLIFDTAARLNDSTSSAPPMRDAAAAANDVAAVSVSADGGASAIQLSESAIIADAVEPAEASRQQTASDLPPTAIPLESVSTEPCNSAKDPIEASPQQTATHLSLASIPQESDTTSTEPSNSVEDAPTADFYRRSWEFLRERRFGLAYYDAVTRTQVAPSLDIGLPPAAVVAVALSSTVRMPGATADRFDEAVQELYEFLESCENRELTQSLKLVLLTTCLQPALFLPTSTARSVLQAIPAHGQGLEGLRHAIVKYTQLGLDLNSAILKGVRESAAWVQLMEQHRRRAQAWLEQTRFATLIFAPTTDAWKAWLSPSGELGPIIDVVINDKRDRVQWAVERVKALDPASVEAQLAKTDKRLRGRLADLRPIEARAVRAFVKHVDEALALVRNWVSLLAERPEIARTDFRHEEASKCRLEVLKQLPVAKRDLAAVRRDSPAGSVRHAASLVAANELDMLEELFNPAAPDSASIPEPLDALFGQDLLAIPGITLDESWKVRSESPADLLQRLDAADVSNTNWSAALRDRCAHKDHLATRRILEQMEAASIPPNELAELRRNCQDEYKSCLIHLERQLDTARAALDRAATYDLLPESEFLDLKAKLDDVRPNDVLQFEPPLAMLEMVQAVISQRRQQRISEIRERLRTEGSSIPEANREQAEGALERGDFLAANEYIDAGIDGRVIPIGPGESQATEYFPDFVRKMIHFLASKPDIRQVINDIRATRNVGPLNLAANRVPNAQVAESARMLEDWFRLKNRTDNGRFAETLIRLLEAFGFDQVRLNGKEPTVQERRWWGEVKATPIADRDTCVVAQFGSSARGVYRVLCSWDRPAEEDLVHAAQKADGSPSPLLVLYFGQMTERGRRDLAALSRARRRTFLVIDETLVFFLCSIRGSRLPQVFAAALPFTVADPYVTTAGLVPPEMFFGRVAELESVYSPTGTNLVYGGRQLGKTALLKEVERRHNNPQQGIVVRWVDLLVEQIGINRPTKHIWATIASALQRDNVIADPLSTPDAVIRHINAWLAGSPTRRIVLLLDEADAFLKEDSRQRYEHVTTLKGLMDATQRRFKVVFAGLHNVQRTSRDVNTPLAHLGQPICIGPLLNEREAREAMGLIERPLSALGYRFESVDIPLKILSHTNYYPSLIQIFCKHLLEHLSDSGRVFFDPSASPPYVITSAHLDTVQNQELREKILAKFRLTLDLDARYRLIALCIALESAEQRESGVILEGVDPRWVRDEALKWWPKGFQNDTTLEGFRVILDEMIGLGILRKVKGQSYTLRSPNLVNLLGPKRELEEQLLDAADREPEGPYEAQHFRRPLAEDIWQRSPLTTQQESEILHESNGVAVLCGTAISGLDEVRAFLEAARENRSLYWLDRVSDLANMLRELLNVLRSEDEGLRLVVIPHTVPWSHAWVARALEQFEGRSSKRRFTRIVFLADTELVWDWVRHGSQRTRLLDNGVKELALKPWADSAMRRWMNETGLAVGEGGAMADITASLGRWTLALNTLGRRSRLESYRWREHLSRLRDELFAPPEAALRLGLHSEVVAPLACLATYGDAIAVNDLAELAPDIGRERFQLALEWADCLAFATREASNKWVLDPSVQRMLTSAVAVP